jgi:cobalt-zinc-cadmium efflux system outer membrane protein
MQNVPIVKSIALPAAVLSLLAGCARFEAKPLLPQQTAEQFEARSLDDPQVKAFLEENLKHGLAGWPLQEWDFDTLTLVALFYHPSLDVARAQWAVARAGVTTAGARPNPGADIAPQYASNAESGISPWIAALTLDTTIETAGKRSHRVERATQESESARLHLIEQAWQVRSRLRAHLLDYAAAHRRVALLREARGIQQQTVKLLEGRLAAGAIASTDVTTARVALLKIQADLGAAQRQVVESRAGVAEALGVPLRALEGHEVKFDLLPVEAGRDLESPEIRRRALHSRADILAALADYAASQSALQLEIARQYPDVHLGPGYEYDQGTHKWGLGVGAELPVLNRNEGPIAEAEAQRTAAAAQFLALQAQVIAEIDRALAARAAAQGQLRQADALQETQQQHVQSVEAMVEAGGADQLELSSARLEATLTELARLEVMVKVQQALGQLEDAVQVPGDAMPSVEQDPRPQVGKEKKRE